MLAKKSKNKKPEPYKEIFKLFEKLTEEPQKFLVARPEKSTKFHNLLQKTYALAINSDKVNVKNAEFLPELVLEDMDDEQIWQQLELRNKIVIPQLIAETARLLALREKKFEIKLKENEEEEEEAEDDDNELEDEDDLNEKNSSRRKKQKPNTTKNVKPSIVDDKFFKLNEMEKFLELEDEKDSRKKAGKSPFNDDDGLDYFSNDFGIMGDYDEDSNPDYKEFFGEEDSEAKSDNEEEKNENYKDFFANNADSESDNENKIENEHAELEEKSTQEMKNKNKNKNKKSITDVSNGGEFEFEEQVLDDDDDDTQNEDEYIAKNERILERDSDIGSETDSNDDKTSEKLKSSHELRQERLMQRIHEYEEERLGEKPWQLKGEIQGTNRPHNSLLEEILEFESTARPAPVITEETTLRLEDIIRQRIKNQTWDDVEAKVRPINTTQEYRKQLVLDQEKSKESLAQIYEKDYQRELAKSDPGAKVETPVEEPETHKEIKRRMAYIFAELDELFGCQYTALPATPEVKIITNTTAIAMEEVTPIAVSSADLLAPEEIYKGPKHELIGKTERTRTDKNRERRKKKIKQRNVKKILEAKDIQRQKLGIPLTKKEEKAKLLKTITKHRNVEKVTASNDHGSLKSSKAFFSKLQDTTASTNIGKKTKKKLDTKTLSAKKLKL